MELLQLKCPACHSAILQSHTTYATQHYGRRILYQCTNCPTYFSETKKTLLAGLKTPISVIWQVLKARTEGMGLNAAARTFEKAKNTILAWESKFTELHQVLFLYALVHEFFVSVIEGDEAYTKVQKNVPPEQSSGWTILLMDRASRFIWELDEFIPLSFWYDAPLISRDSDRKHDPWLVYGSPSYSPARWSSWISRA